MIVPTPSCQRETKQSTDVREVTIGTLALWLL